MIKIDEEYFINANESCYTLERKTTVKDVNSKNYGKEASEIEGYYTSIDNALNGYLKIKMRKYVASEEENTISEAIEQLEVMSADEKERELYEIRERSRLTYNTEINEAKKQGLEEGKKIGIEQGLEQGKDKEKKAIAKKMKDQGMDVTLIQTLTGLTKKEIDLL